MLSVVSGCAVNSSSSGPLVIAEQGFFFVGGRYVPVANGDHIMADQMYVHYQIPHAKKHPYPIILIHGGGQTANNFESTPDGREGWATNFCVEDSPCISSINRAAPALPISLKSTGR